MSAQVYHLANLILATPEWRAIVVAVAAGLLLRVTIPGRSQSAATITVVLAAIALVLPSTPLWPATSLARLPGALLMLVLPIVGAGQTRRALRWVILPSTAAFTAWWLRGAPLTAAGGASVVPVFLCLLAILAIVRRLTSGDSGWAGIAASAAFATGIWMAGGPVHWVFAALLPAAAGAALLGRAEAAAQLAQATAVIAVAMIVALDRGRLTPVDLATVAPLAVWAAAPRLLPRLNRAGPALAASLAAIGGVAFIWAATRLLWPR